MLNGCGVSADPDAARARLAAGAEQSLQRPLSPIACKGRLAVYNRPHRPWRHSLSQMEGPAAQTAGLAGRVSLPARVRSAARAG